MVVLSMPDQQGPDADSALFLTENVHSLGWLCLQPHHGCLISSVRRCVTPPLSHLLPHGSGLRLKEPDLAHAPPCPRSSCRLPSTCRRLTWYHLNPSRNTPAVLWPFTVVVPRVLSGTDNGQEDPVSHWDVHALDPDRPHPGDQGGVNDGVSTLWACLSSLWWPGSFVAFGSWEMEEGAGLFSALHLKLSYLG